MRGVEDDNHDRGTEFRVNNVGSIKLISVITAPSFTMFQLFQAE